MLIPVLIFWRRVTNSVTLPRGLPTVALLSSLVSVGLSVPIDFKLVSPTRLIAAHTRWDIGNYDDNYREALLGVNAFAAIFHRQHRVPRSIGGVGRLRDRGPPLRSSYRCPSSKSERRHHAARRRETARLPGARACSARHRPGRGCRSLSSPPLGSAGGGLRGTTSPDRASTTTPTPRHAEEALSDRPEATTPEIARVRSPVHGRDQGGDRDGCFAMSGGAPMAIIREMVRGTDPYGFIQHDKRDLGQRKRFAESR